MKHRKNFLYRNLQGAKEIKAEQQLDEGQMIV